MANNYTKFSFALPPAPADSEEKSQELMREWVDSVQEELDAAASSDDQEVVDWWEENGQGVQLNYFTSFGGIVISDDCGEGNVTSAMNLTQRYLKTFGIKGGILISWANTCDRPRPGEFGGGGVVVTAEGEAGAANEYDAVVKARDNGVEVLT